MVSIEASFCFKDNELKRKIKFFRMDVRGDVRELLKILL